MLCILTYEPYIDTQEDSKDGCEDDGQDGEIDEDLQAAVLPPLAS